MSDEIATFDPKLIAESIKGQIKHAVVAAIPDEQWSRMVEAEVSSFITRDLPALIQAEIKAQMIADIKVMLGKPEYQERWNSSNHQQPGEAVQAILAAIAPDMVKCLFSQVVQEAVNNLRYDINSNRF